MNINIIKFNDFRKVNEELGFDLVPVEYKYTLNNSYYKDIEFNVGNDLIKIQFIYFNDVWSRSYTINEFMYKIKGKDLKISREILGKVSYVTIEFLKNQSPEILVIEHINDINKVDGSLKRMKMHRLYLEKKSHELGYIYSVYKYFHRDKEKFITIVSKNIEQATDYMGRIYKDYELVSK